MSLAGESAWRDDPIFSSNPKTTSHSVIVLISCSVVSLSFESTLFPCEHWGLRPAPPLLLAVLDSSVEDDSRDRQEWKSSPLVGGSSWREDRAGALSTLSEPSTSEALSKYKIPMLDYAQDTIS